MRGCRLPYLYARLTCQRNTTSHVRTLAIGGGMRYGMCMCGWFFSWSIPRTVTTWCTHSRSGRSSQKFNGQGGVASTQKISSSIPGIMQVLGMQATTHTNLVGTIRDLGFLRRVVIGAIVRELEKCHCGQNPFTCFIRFVTDHMTSHAKVLIGWTSDSSSELRSPEPRGHNQHRILRQCVCTKTPEGAVRSWDMRVSTFRLFVISPWQPHQA